MEWEITYCTYVICHLRNEGTSLGPSWLKKVQLKGGEESSDQPVDSSSAEQVLSGKKRKQPFRKRKPPLKARRLPSFTYAQAQSLQTQSGSWATGVRDIHSAHFSLTALSSVILKGWHWASLETQKLISSCGSESSPGCLGPFGDTGAGAANKLWHRAASTAMHSRCSFLGLTGLACSLFVFQLQDEKAYPWPQVKSSKLSPAHVLNTLLWVCLLYLDCFGCFAFPSQNLQQDVKQDVCKTTKPKLYRYLHCFNPEIDSKRQNISIK